MITLGEASRLTGLGKTTLSRAIKAGRLSATRTPVGSYEIDPAELARCYPFKAPTEATDATVAATGPQLWVHRTGATPDATGATAVLEAQVAGLREIGDLLRRQLDEVREDRERWRSQAEAVQRLITDIDHRRPADKVQDDSEQSRSRSARRPMIGNGQDHGRWWLRIAGRNDVQVVTLLGCIALMLVIIANQLHWL